MSRSPDARVYFRFYEELNDTLPPARRKATFGVTLPAGMRVDEAIRSFGVDTGAVDLVLVNGEPASFSRPLASGDRVSVYPVFESLDVSSVSGLRPKPLREVRFLAETGLEGLARLLRLLGFDASIGDPADRKAHLESAERERRVILTAFPQVPAGAQRTYRVTASRPRLQLLEVLDRFDLAGVAEPLSRCPRCNAPLRWASAATCASCGLTPPGQAHIDRARLFCGRILGKR